MVTANYATLFLERSVYYRLVSASLASHDLRPQTTFNGSHLLKLLLSSRGLLRFYHRDSHCIYSASVLTSYGI